MGASPLSFALSAERLALLSRLASRLAAATAAAPAQPCRVFHKVWSSGQSSPASSGGASGFTEGVSSARVGAAGWGLWRPRPPPGYAPLGDVVSMGTLKPPSEPVRVIRDSPAFTAPPVSFQVVDLPSSEAAAAAAADGLVLWRPVPPPGFVALGVVGALVGAGPPPPDALRCVRAELVSAAEGTRGRACAGVGAPPLWILDNCARTCETSAACSPELGGGLDIRLPMGLPGGDQTKHGPRRLTYFPPCHPY